MKKLLLFVFILLGFIAKSQELDEIYIREAVYIKDSSLIAATYGDTILTIEQARLLFTGGVGSQWVDSTSGIVYTGGNVGIGTADPLSALHLNKGTGLTNGLTFGTGNGLSLFGTDELSIYAGGKRLISFKENITEQVMINPDGDLTGTLDNPNLAISYPNMGFYALSPNVLQVTVNGVNTALFSNTGMQTRDNIPVASNNYELGSPTRIWNEVWTNEINNSTDLSIEINSIEAMRLTEDTVFMDSTFAPLQIKFPDGTIQTTAATGDLTGVMQVIKTEVLYTNTTQTTIITLPTDAVISEIMVEVVTLFDGTGTDRLTIGTGSSTNKYISTTNPLNLETVFFEQGKGSGVSNSYLFINETNFTSRIVSDKMAGSTNIVFQYTDQNSDATQGTAYVYVEYSEH